MVLHHFSRKKDIANPLEGVKVRKITYEIEWEGRKFQKNSFGDFDGRLDRELSRRRLFERLRAVW